MTVGQSMDTPWAGAINASVARPAQCAPGGPIFAQRLVSSADELKTASRHALVFTHNDKKNNRGCKKQRLYSTLLS